MTDQLEEPLDPILARWYKQLSDDHRTRAPGLWRLPPEHSFAHHYCFSLNDTLGHLIRDGEQNELFSVTLDLSPEGRDDLQRIDPQGEELFAWMENNGYGAQVKDLMERQILAALVSDAAQFIYEALRCSEKGKLVVTYSLLRKPLRENLLLLELLLTDREQFLKLLAEETDRLGIYSLPKSERALPIIESSVKMIGREEMLDPQFIYDLRYSKHKHFSFEPTWNKATHLVTSGKHYATESNNLNFIFSGSEATREQWDDLYRKLPLLLFYFVEVVVSLLKRVVGASRLNDQSACRTRELGFALVGHFQLPEKPSRLADFAIDCPLCGNPMLGEVEELMELYEEGRARCGACALQIKFDGSVPPKWSILVRQLTLPVMLPLRRMYSRVRGRKT